MKENTIVYQATSMSEVQTLLKNNQNIRPLAGCTELLLGQSELSITLPKYLISLAGIKELHEVNKTERYLELGAMVSLDQILNLGQKNIPSILFSSLKTISTINIRKLSSIGGNLAITKTLKTLYAVMMALDVRIEIKTGTESFWLPFSKYVSDELSELRSKPYIITRVRIYDENWSYNFFKRIGKKGIIDHETAYFIFLVKLQKNLITDVSVCFSAKSFFHSREFENTILGLTLPFSKKDITHILEASEKFFTDEVFIQGFHRQIFFNLLLKCLIDLNR